MPFFITNFQWLPSLKMSHTHISPFKETRKHAVFHAHHWADMRSIPFRKTCTIKANVLHYGCIQYICIYCYQEIHLDSSNFVTNGVVEVYIVSQGKAKQIKMKNKLHSFERYCFFFSNFTTEGNKVKIAPTEIEKIFGHYFFSGFRHHGILRYFWTTRISVIPSTWLLF